MAIPWKAGAGGASGHCIRCVRIRRSDHRAGATGYPDNRRILADPTAITLLIDMTYLNSFSLTG